MSPDYSLYRLVGAVRDSPAAMAAWAKRRGTGLSLGSQRALDEAWNAGRHPLPMLQLVAMVHPEHTKAIRAELGAHLRACRATHGGASGTELTSSACKRCAGTIRHMLRETLSWEALVAHSATWREQQAARAGQPAPGLPEALAAMRDRLAPHAAELDAQRALDDLDLDSTAETTRTP